MITERRFTGHGWLVLLIFVALLADGVLSQVLSQWIMVPTFTGVPQLTLMCMIMITLFVPKEKYIVIIAAIAGLVFDSFYTGMLGITALLWPLVVFLVRQVQPLVPRSPLFVGAVMVISITVFQAADYMMNRFVGYGTGSLVTLIANHLAPGLLINVILFALIYLPLRRLLLNLNGRY